MEHCPYCLAQKIGTWKMMRAHHIETSKQSALENKKTVHKRLLNQHLGMGK